MNYEAKPLSVEDLGGRPTITVAEYAVLVGVSRDCAYEAIQRGEVPALRIGRRVVIPTVVVLRQLGLLEDESRNSAASHPDATAR